MQRPIHYKDGPAVAAMLAAGLGCAVLGLATVLVTWSPAVKEALDWYAPVGPLSGKTGTAVLAWLISWGLLHWRWRARELRHFARIVRWTILLIGLGWLGTFPPLYDLFAGH